MLSDVKSRIRENHEDILADVAAQSLIIKDAKDTVWNARREAERRQAEIADELEQLSQSNVKYAFGLAVDASNAMRTLMASFDLSGALRQGGYFSFAYPELQKEAVSNMLTSFTEKGYGQAVLDVEADVDFGEASRAGVEFAIAGTHEDYKAEEVFRGDAFIKSIPLFGKIVDKTIAGWSERTYTAFLDTQE